MRDERHQHRPDARDRMIAADPAQERQHEIETEALHEPQQQEARATDRKRDRIDRREVRNEMSRLRERTAVDRRNAGERGELTQNDHDRRGVDEPGDHRVTQQIHDAAHLRQPQQPQRSGGLKTDDRSYAEVGIRKRVGVCANRFRHHDRDHRNGTYREARRRTEHRVEQRRNDARVQPRFRRQASEERVRDRLRNGDDADDPTGEQVVAQIAAFVAGDYVDDRKMIAPVRNPIGNGERELHSVSGCIVFSRSRFARGRLHSSDAALASRERS